jgi:group II intron reverse transcriptase/maturase
VDELKAPGKPSGISKRAVWEAWEKVRANKGAPGVDAVTVAEFESDLKNNLYKMWNRLSSGTCFPPPVRAVEVPKPHGGGTRILGVPAVGDRVAQTVVAGVIEAGAEPVFHPDSCRYRPGRSALDAIAACRRRCWENDWIIDLDVRKFFDTMPWDLAVKAIQAVTGLPWVVLYVRRWLAAPLALPDGTLQQRDRGTPQGSAVSPVIASLFLHYAFDAWMTRTFPGVAFERYVDDAVIHCAAERQARQVLAALRERMSQVGLALHPDKTRVVCCQHARRRGSHEHTSFTFLGYGFRGRRVRTRSGRITTGFVPAISKDALNKISSEVRSWRLHTRTGLSEADLARRINPVVRGWMNYYGAFYPSALYPLLARINAYLLRWLRKKHKRLRGRRTAQDAWNRAVKQRPRFFAHWAWVTCTPPSGDQNDKSRVTRDCYARFRESRGLKCPRPLDNLCHQAIFVDDATHAVMPPDPEMIQVGDAIWQRPQWRGLVQGAMRPVGIAEVLVLPQHHRHPQVAGRVTVQSTWKKSAVSIVDARVCRNCRHVVSVRRCGAGGSSGS